ncbi:MAG: ATP-dependent Clp protease proteolytic subunit [Parachlamydiales bacterium]|jgi:ATP-dependent Clp protease protease subunit
MAQQTNSNGSFLTLEDNIDSTLLDSRRIFLCDAVDSNSAQSIIRKLWYLEMKDPGKPILFIINSPGGSVDSGFAIWDQIHMLSSPVTTLVTGLAASFGSVLSLAAAPKKRFATPNARFMIHQPHVAGVIQGQASDLEIQALEILRTRKALVKLYMEQSGKDEATIERALDRDSWLSPEEAIEFGLLDGIVRTYKELNF